MGKMRKPFQGVGNIIRFNWHFYVLSVGFVILALVISSFLTTPFHLYVALFCVLVIGSTVISLLVSYYVYDFSGIYKLEWLNELMVDKSSKVVNIHAGFDETSLLLKEKFELLDISFFDFYDPLKHTEFFSIQYWVSSLLFPINLAQYLSIEVRHSTRNKTEPVRHHLYPSPQWKYTLR